ncbi:hypothetical protein F2Q68_00040357 [Brassica cretica]|uniref:Uncharacterized protein n=1 Tax=Brassica cretica TaxID=69181 RepID=A0A8S9MTN4_BRACR|nr:hypothetical protein F2Q68_00040357 [Brassica cretica]
MDTAIPPGFSRSLSGSMGNRKPRNEITGIANLLERSGTEKIQKEIMDLGEKKQGSENVAKRSENEGDTEKRVGDMEKEKEDSKSKEKEMEENIGSTKKSSDLETIKEMEVEEGEIEENWQDVTPKKASRSSTLKFGQVKILTPSRFPNLLEVDEKGDVINVVETEEILSVVEEIVEEGVDTERVIEENKEKEKEDIDTERKENDYYSGELA